MDSKAECDQIKLAHVARKKYQKKKLKQTNAGAHLVQYRFRIRESSPEGIRVTMEEKINDQFPPQSGLVDSCFYGESRPNSYTMRW